VGQYGWPDARLEAVIATAAVDETQRLLPRNRAIFRRYAQIPKRDAVIRS
jgi:hypothetical protein